MLQDSHGNSSLGNSGLQASLCGNWSAWRRVIVVMAAMGDDEIRSGDLPLSALPLV
jgi:hypothetical protein